LSGTIACLPAGRPAIILAGGQGTGTESLSLNRDISNKRLNVANPLDREIEMNSSYFLPFFS